MSALEREGVSLGILDPEDERPRLAVIQEVKEKQ
jgi:hypothetical protein